MFFVRLGNVAAWLILSFGALRVAIALFVATQGNPQLRAELAARYLGHGTAGQAIDDGVLAIGCAILLGILVQIARSPSDLLWASSPISEPLMNDL